MKLTNNQTWQPSESQQLYEDGIINEGQACKVYFYMRGQLRLSHAKTVVEMENMLKTGNTWPKLHERESRYHTWNQKFNDVHDPDYIPDSRPFRANDHH